MRVWCLVFKKTKMVEELVSKISRDVVRHPFWAMSPEEILKVLETNSDGLGDEEILRRRNIFGPNAIQEQRHLTRLKIIFNQLRSPLILVLIAAGSITLILKDWLDAAVIFAAVLANTAFGFYQENKAEHAVALLKTYLRTRARVRRGGSEHELDAEELVPGDVIHISQGDRIPADARIIFANDLEVDESVLTGESLPEEKNSRLLPVGVGLADRTSMVFSGTLVVGGLGDAAITATGSATEFGKIAALIASRGNEATPLQRAISRFTFHAGLVIGVLVAALFLLGVSAGYGIFEMFFIAVAVAVSAVPEGLPVALTVILAVGVERLAKRKGIVRRLLAAETLGSTSIILTDKTGTLTQAKMELAEVLAWDEKEGNWDTSEGPVKKVLSRALVNTDVVVENPGENPGSWRMFGRALEVALVRGSAERGIALPNVLSKTRVVERLPFSSEHKFSATISHAEDAARFIIFGAPEIILGFTGIHEKKKAAIAGEIAKRALMGGRILGVIAKEISRNHTKIGQSPAFEGFDFLGILAFRDPLRPHVRDSIRMIGQAGVRTVIVTGDHQGTAEAVARELGMIDGEGAVLNGEDLGFLSKDELRARAREVSVYARVTPAQKVMLVELYQNEGEIVAVTGDGVNDAPALKTADIGIAVGSGTDVAKSAADLVILDDNFETLVAAIEEGRRILDNIRKVVVYLLSNSFDELLLIGGSLLAGLVLPLTALQILFVNFFSDSFPALALAFEKGIDGLGSRPRKLARKIFDREMKFLILIIGVFTSFLLFALYYFLLRFGFTPELVRTFIFASFGTYTLFLSFSMRSLEKSILSYSPFENIYLVFGAGLGAVLTALVLYVPPLQEVFGTVSLPPFWVAAVLGVGLLNIGAVEFGKWLFRRRILDK